MDERSIREKIASLGVDALLAEAASLTQKVDISGTHIRDILGTY
jgi:predicted ABC-class ATPase